MAVPTRLLHCVVVIICIRLTTCDLEPTLQRCCTLGANWASEGLKCVQFPAPVSGIPAEEQSVCLSTVEICCIKTHREGMCQLGKSAAEDGKDCVVDKKLGGEYFKDCCEACKLGMISGSMGSGCNFSKFSFGHPWDPAYHACCLKTSPPTTSTLASPSTASAASSAASSASTRLQTSLTTAPSNGIPTPALDSLCDLLPGELCAHICIPVPDSYRCDCRRGFSLMADGKSCQQEDLPDRCKMNNPCAHKCVDTGVAIECSCHNGFLLAPDERSCNDIDECQLEVDGCDHSKQVCRNEPGTYSCVNSDGSLSKPTPRQDEGANPGDADNGKCPVGYQFNFQSQVCDDIDECLLNKAECGKNNICQNTIGSYTCGRVPAVEDCPPGFRYNSVQKTCRDVNECAEALDDCKREKQYCLNTEGGFTCQDRTEKSQCPAGYKFSKIHSACEDINECAEQIHICNLESESCINEPGGYRCGPQTPEPPSRRIPDRTWCQAGYKMHPTYRNCVDVDECAENSDPPCDSNQNCVNTPGSYVCTCKTGYQLDAVTQACVDINECQINLHDCLMSQRCDNTIGSFHCIRFTSCGTGYTLNSQSGLCEDDDECVLRTDNCRFIGPIWQCRNTAGSFRCERKRCEGNLKLTSVGTCVGLDGHTVGTTVGASSTTVATTTAERATTTVPPPPIRAPPPTETACPPGYQIKDGTCTDINECERPNICRRNQRCVNGGGSYRCINFLNCIGGFEINEEGTQCVDVDECATSTHDCGRGQLCQNRPGGYSCQCPAGHTLNSAKECVDIDECTQFAGHVCSINSECQNMPGSYRCLCKAGFRQAKDSKACDDIDECTESPGVCHQTCINIWGSYHCVCGPGFTLNSDNRSCSDVDECHLFRDRHLCVGPCVNQPGSYTCRCPEGYRLGSDGRSCQDIDECQGGSSCKDPTEICLNTRGSYRCNTINCPQNFVKDTEHKNRCKRASLYCREGDLACLRLPLSYSFNFITFVSNLAISPVGHLDLFTMRGPLWQTTTARFNLEMLDSRAPVGIKKVSKNYFRLRNTAFNQAVISLVDSIPGPQEIELQLTMDLHHNGELSGSAVAKLFIYVSQYEY